MKPGTLKSILSKWLFATVVMLGLFTFSGFGSLSTNKITTPDTTLVVKIDRKAVKSIRYRIPSKVNRAERFKQSSANNFDELSYVHTQSVQLTIRQTSNQFANYKVHLFYNLVNYRQNRVNDYLFI